jgi:enamine deaminase RidA (YjgF/YER057c/UK114 family)
LRSAIGSLDALKRCVKVTGFVASAPDFTDQPKVINGASDLLVEIFGEAGRHARAAVGVHILPMNSPVEIEFIFEVNP